MVKGSVLAGALWVGGALAASPYVDVAVFYLPAQEEARLEVYYALPLDLFVARGGYYEFNVGARLTRAGDGAVIAEQVKHKVAEVQEGVETPTTVGQFTFKVPYGEYNLSLGTADANDPARPPVIVTNPITVAAPGEGVGISSIELVSAAGNVEGASDNEFVKYPYLIIPNPTKIVDDREASPQIYFEVYNLPAEGGAGLNIKYDVSLINGRRFASVSKTLERWNQHLYWLDALDLTGIPPGTYVLTVSVETGEGKVLAGTKKEFVVFHEYSSWELENVTGRYSPLSYEEERVVRKEISFVASADELAAFDALSAEEKPIFLENFWRRRDPTPETPENEFKDAFYARYRYAQEHFTTPFREGVDTDRGRVYLRFGEPDQITSNPVGLPSETNIDSSSWSTKPVEVWEYFARGGIDNQYRMFVFVDDGGDGDFRVRASTVPGYGKAIRADVSPNAY